MTITELFIDPVCGMTINSKFKTISRIYNGSIYHFCSQFCRDEFDKIPAKYGNKTPKKFEELKNDDSR